MAEESAIGMAKRAMRQRYRPIIAGFAERESASSAIVSNLIASELFGVASILIGYMPMACEPDIRPVLESWLRSGRALWLPRYVPQEKRYALARVAGLDERNLAMGHYGILEPRDDIPQLDPPYDFSEAAIWLVPGVAFTARGHRLGRGGGYYDRLLESSAGLRIGVCFGCQLAAELPVTEQDAVMDYILTESCIHQCSSRSGLH